MARGGLNWELDLSEGIDLAIYLFGAFEWTTVRACQRLVKPGDTALDIGANIGAHTLNLARCVGAEGRVLAFEPTRFAFEKQRQNILLNPQLAPRITAQQCMLTESDQSGLTSAVFSGWPLASDADLHQHHLGRAETTEGAEARSLDSALAALGVDRVDFIKMDVDGYECDVLGGAAETLSRCKPTIVMEFAPYLLEEQDRSFPEMIAMLSRHGYRYFDLAGKRELVGGAEELSARIPVGSSMNVVAQAA